MGAARPPLDVGPRPSRVGRQGHWHSDDGLGFGTRPRGNTPRSQRSARLGARRNCKYVLTSEGIASEYGHENHPLRMGHVARPYRRTPPVPVWPEGISIRNIRHPEDTEAAYRADDEAFEDHWGYVETPFEEGFKRWKHYVFEIRKPDPSLWFLAMDGDEIAGMVSCRMEADDDPDKGWVSVLGVRRPWRRRGLGLALLR